MSEQEAPVIQEQISRKIHDADLNFLIQAANFANSNNGVTLLSKGMLISGVVISEKEYYETVAGSYGERGESAPAIAEYFWVRSEHAIKPEDYDSLHEFNFINLKSAKISNNSGSFNSLGSAVIRLKLEEIDGYILGIVS